MSMERPLQGAPRYLRGGPQNRGPGLPILKILPCQKYRLVILSSELVEIDAHYTGERTQPCREGRCIYCQDEHANPLRWQGWCAVSSVHTGMQFILSVTPGAAIGCPGLFSDSGSSLRGSVITVERTRNSHRAPMRIGLERGLMAALKLPDEPDVQSILERMWQASLKLATLLRMGASPPTPVPARSEIEPDIS